MTIDRTIKRDRRDAQRKKRRPVHGRGLEHVLNGIKKRVRRIGRRRDEEPRRECG